jgi:hypothetical protein
MREAGHNPCQIKPRSEVKGATTMPTATKQTRAARHIAVIRKAHAQGRKNQDLTPEDEAAFLAMIGGDDSSDADSDAGDPGDSL